MPSTSCASTLVPAAAAWAIHEFGHAPLGDERRTQRLTMIATAFAQQPTAPIPQAGGDWADVKGAYRFFENDAEIRKALGGFLELQGRMELKVDKVFRADDVALIFSSWSLERTGPDGEPLELTGQTSDVVRHQADGTWRFVIDNPPGAAATRGR